MSDFSNSILQPKDLPEINSETFNPLEIKYRTILLLRLLFIFIFISGGFVAFLLISDENIPNNVLIIILSIVAFVIVYSIVITFLGFPKKGYLVREKDLSFQRGIITYKLTSVSFNRIQHVEVNQGVLAKIFKLSSIKIYTAGGNSSDLSIHGLPVEVAHNLKAFLSEKISEHE